MDAPQHLRIGLTADLHFGTRHAAGYSATVELANHLFENPPDLLILAGDVGAGEDFDRCLDLFASLPSRKALIPGNHDIWVRTEDERGDSCQVYEEHLPKICSQFGFHYLDQFPILLPESDLAIIGSINWYDYSWSIERLKEIVPDWEMRLRRKKFSRGMHNDANFVQWSYSDQSFTQLVVDILARQLKESLREVNRALVVTHHPPFPGLNYPNRDPNDLDELLWRAFSGNTRLEAVLQNYADRIPFAFCGHTHFARECEYHGIRGYNIGGDYDFKRLLYLDWPEGNVEAIEFGNH
jgi:predicted phosphohydrolase